MNPYLLTALILLGVLLLLICLLLAASAYLYKFAVKSRHDERTDEQFDRWITPMVNNKNAGCSMLESRELKTN